LAAQAEALCVRFLGLDNEVTINARFVLGIIAERRGNLDRAEALLRQVLVAQEQTFGSLDRRSLATFRRLANTVRLRGRAEEARLLLLESVNRRVQFYGLCHIQTSAVINDLFSLLREQRDYAAIRDLCEGWIREILTWPPEPDPHERSRRGVVLSHCAVTLATLPEPVPFDAVLAVRAADEAVALQERRNGWVTLGAALSRANQNEKALEAIRTAAQQRDWKGGNDLHWFVQASIHARLGQAEQALSCYKRARGADLKSTPWGEVVPCLRTDVERRLGLTELAADALAQP
jgi:tetratricopeptide (TPR) repeat protein